MLPYYEVPAIPLGPLKIEPFGIFVALGVLTAARICVTQAQKRGLDPRPLADFALWGLIGGMLGGHLVHLFLYHPEELREGPLKILRVWDGLSSFGGLLGGIIAAVIFFRRRHVPFARYSDALALGVAPGWAIARIGCFAVHDHPGVRTNFFLALDFPGGPRHDLGLYDALWLGVCTLVLFLVARRHLLTGRLLALLAVMYGVARFYFDTLRATDLAYVDARYFGLTPAQYGSILIVLWGVWKLSRGAPAASSAPVTASAAPTTARER